MLYRRSLLFHWRTNLATALCVATAGAVLTGAIVVGDSMRASLRDLAVRRLGPVDCALVTGHFFREALASDVSNNRQFKASGADACPLILLQGTIELADSRTRVNRINILGVDDRFWHFGGQSTSPDRLPGLDTSVILNEQLARALGASPSNDVLVRLGTQSSVPAETLLGRRNDITVSLRMTVDRVLAADGWSGFSLTPTQNEPYNAYVPLATLQRAIKQRGRVNAILVGGARTTARTPDAEASSLQKILGKHVQLADCGLKLRLDDKRACFALGSESLLLPPSVEEASMNVARALGAPAVPVLTYLANTISIESPPRAASLSAPSAATTSAARREIPYSTVTAIDPGADGVLSSLTLVDGKPAPALEPDEILLNDWAAEDLHARPGDRIRLSYYAMGPFGQLRTDTATFVLRGIVRMQGLADDPSLTPEYEGVTNAKHLADWDPPFPIDFRRVRPKDEAYWDQHRATPKAFVSLRRGQELWASESARFGRLTSIRFGHAAGKDLAATAALFESSLRGLTAVNAGLVFEPIRAQAITASRGSTDFSMLFMGFSIFLIISAAMLVALVFRLGVERRASEVGILLAVGFRPRAVTLALLTEGAWLAGLGSFVGLIGALGYARLMLAGLQSWWSDAVGVSALQLHVQPLSLLIGFAVSLAVGLASIAWGIRGLSRMSARSLLAGSVESAAHRFASRRVRMPSAVAAAAAGVAAALIVIATSFDSLPKATAFFGGGASMLVASLAGFWAWTRLEHHRVIGGGGPIAIARLGIRNAVRNRRRSLVTTGLIASATFIIIAVGANRRGVESETRSRQSGTAGFGLLAESTVPILHDINTADGREALGLSQATRDALRDAAVIPFRLRPGDEASCLNLYQPRQPRILGATLAMIERGGFAFKSSLARTREEKDNPWTLLTKPLPDGAIPAIGDDNTVTWLLHLGLGKDLSITDDRGRKLQLRIVALLAGSVLQGELVIAESRFVERFPSIGGYSFFLIETSASEAAAQGLSRDLASYGLEVTPTAERLRRYLAVENAYLSAFGSLGGLGIVLGTLALAAVLLRSVFERRGELALLQALGWRRIDLGWLVLTENSALLLSGLAAGAISALLAVAPHVASNARAVPWASLGVTLALVFLAGTIAAAMALIAVMRSPLLPSLRAE